MTRCACVLAAALTLPSVARGQARDTVEVLAVTSPSPLVLGVPGIVDVRCRIVLRSASRGMARFGFNEYAPHDVVLGDGIALSRAVTDTVIRLTVVPVKWSAEGRSYLMAAVGPALVSDSWLPTSRTRRRIEFREDSSPVGLRDVGGEVRTRRTAVSGAGDSLTVEVRSTAALRRGVPSEVEVEIETTLRSMADATVRVLVNGADPLRYVSSTEFRAGRGTLRRTLRVTVVPVDHGSQGVFGILVALAPEGIAGATGARSLIRVLIPLVVTQ